MLALGAVGSGGEPPFYFAAGWHKIIAVSPSAPPAGAAYGFSGHQTFPFRYAWLPKAVQHVRRDPGLFRAPDALVRLGVGQNMVASIRHWGNALDVFTTSVDGTRLRPLGELLFADPPPPPPPPKSKEKKHRSPVASYGRNGGPGNGSIPFEQPVGAYAGQPAADPYLEDPGTLWLLHWQLASRPAPASTWHLVFTRYAETVFTRDELAWWLLRCARGAGNRRTSESSIRRDLDVFLRTYLPAREDSRRPLEDSFDCPLAELGLLETIDAARFAIRRSPRPSLPVAILLYALLDFWRREAETQQTLAFERVQFDVGSPGAAFKLDDRSLVSMLERLPSGSGVRYDETAGRRVLLREGGWSNRCRPFAVLERYYGVAQA